MVQPSSEDIKQYLMVTAAYLLLTIVLFYPMIQHITWTVPGTGGDVYQSMWDLWWVPYSLFTLHSTPYFTNYVFYPVGANLATQTLAPIAGLVSILFQPLSLAFAYNMIFLIGFVLSGIFAYMLTYHITKHKFASFLAGMIFAFSPIHTIQAFGHLQYTNIEFIPLFLLFFLKMTEDKKLSDAVFAGLAFVLLTFMGDIEQALMTIVLTVVLLAYLLLSKNHRHKLLNQNFLICFAAMVFIALVFGSPFIIGIYQQLNSNVLSGVNSQGTIQYNELYSPDLLSFFIPSQYNGLSTFLPGSLESIDAPAASERTTYIGYSVILLCVLALAYDYKDKFKKTAPFLIVLIVFALLSIGPVLQIDGTFTLPGIYQIYHLIPLFNVLREPGRFDVVIELMLAIIAAIGFMELEKKYPSSKKYLPAVFVVLLLIDYNSFPTSSAMFQNMYTNATIPSAFTQIGALAGNFTVLVLPALPNLTSSAPNLYPGIALYYQTAFKRPLVGGYTTRTNTTQMLSLVNIPLVTASYYLQENQGLVYGSPIDENYTNVTSFLLGAYNVGFVAVATRAYNQTGLQNIVAYLSTFLGYPVYQGNNTIVFQTSQIADTAGTSLTAFTPVIFSDSLSVWQPGWVFCRSLEPCNSTYSGTWFAENPAFVNVYSPNSTQVTVSFSATAPLGVATPEYIYFDDQLVNVLNLTSKLQPYSFNISANAGMNQLILLSRATNSTGYANIGIMNMTFKKHAKA